VLEPIKKAHKNQLFAMVTDVQDAIALWLHQQPQVFYRHGIDGLMKLWDACLNNHGHIPNNLVIMLRGVHNLLIYQRTLIVFHLPLHIHIFYHHFYSRSSRTVLSNSAPFALSGLNVNTANTLFLSDFLNSFPFINFCKVSISQNWSL
jgi:hypothetical protein